MPAPLPAPVAGQFWTGVAMMDNATTLAKAAQLFAGRNPTAAETAAVAGGDAMVLMTTIRSYMQGPAFDRFLDEHGMTKFLTNRVVARGQNRGLVEADFPRLANNLGGVTVTGVNNIQNAFDGSLRREPIELMKFIVRNDRSWKEIVEGNYTVVNPVLAQALNATLQSAFTNPNDVNEWRQATIPEVRFQNRAREHAGVLSTQAWLDGQPTTPTNRNRHRVYVALKDFAATDVTALAARPIETSSTFAVPVMQDPNCTVCHNVIDPMAAAWQNWSEVNRYLANVNNTTALPASYRNASYPNDANGQEYYRAGDNWFRDGATPGYGATPMPGGYTGTPNALAWFGQQLAADPRFARGAVDFWFSAVFGREVLRAPTDPASPQYANQRSAFEAQKAELDMIAGRFASGGFNVKNLLTDLVMSNWFRATGVTNSNAGRAIELADVGSSALLLPSQLNAKILALLGTAPQGAQSLAVNFAYTNATVAYQNAALNFGDFDGSTRVNRAKEYTMLQTTVMDGIAATMSCGWVQADFGRAVAQRLLFPSVQMTDTPATAAGVAAITENVRHLHNALLNENLPANHPEIQRTVKLFTDVWNDRGNAPARPVTGCSLNNNNDANYTGRAWAAAVAYVVGDPKFLFR